MVDGWLEEKEDSSGDVANEPNPYNLPLLFFPPITCKRRVDSSSIGSEPFKDAPS